MARKKTSNVHTGKTADTAVQKVETAKAVVEKAVEEKTVEVKEAVKETAVKAEEKVEKAAEKATEAVAEVKEAAKETAEKAVETAKETVEKTAEAAKTTAKKTATKAKTATTKKAAAAKKTVKAKADAVKTETKRKVTRKPPKSGKGKGFVLNDALSLSKGEIIGVFDADTQVEKDFLNIVMPYLNNPKVQGVQTRVKMYNKDENFLANMQHVEFESFGNTLIAKDNLGKSGFLGDNGQFVKKQAILDGEKWDYLNKA